MANIMLYAWICHGIRPSLVYNMSEGELKIIRAFYIIEAERKSQGAI
ncbi:MAG: hypothetical protein RSD67_05965 [Oscillospiraceae bacterium]